VFIENHDIPRFATAVNRDIRKEKVGAALNLLIGGTPAIYYGQEIGMLGKSGHYGLTDANEVPDREAFNWYKSNAGKGMAFWYKNSGPWWDHRYNQPNDGISVEEQASDKYSLWSYYHQLISLRKSHSALITGSYRNLENRNVDVFSFLRSSPQQQMLVVVNLSAVKQQVNLVCNPGGKRIRPVFGAAEAKRDHHGALDVTLPGYGIAVYQLK
jgi:glycosidase